MGFAQQCARFVHPPLKNRKVAGFTLADCTAFAPPLTGCGSSFVRQGVASLGITLAPAPPPPHSRSSAAIYIHVPFRVSQNPFRATATQPHLYPQSLHLQNFLYYHTLILQRRRLRSQSQDFATPSIARTFQPRTTQIHEILLVHSKIKPARCPRIADLHPTSIKTPATIPALQQPSDAITLRRQTPIHPVPV